MNKQITIPHIHILGICGTFMAGIAQLAKQMGHEVSGSDKEVYPPMSDQLEEAGIKLTEGYAPEHLPPDAEVVIGNALSRGNPSVEYILAQRLPYTSGAQWLAENVLQGKKVIAVSGTHGKTTTTSMLAWILECASLNPGFLIGGVAKKFGFSARYTESEWFVIEADEYDSAFFDKRSKFVHYRPTILLINNLEFDHADIFDDMRDIQKQFHHGVRIVPANGVVIYPQDDKAIQEVIDMGCWAPCETFGGTSDWQVQADAEDGSRFSILYQGQLQGKVNWQLLGLHNLHNALAAVVCAHAAGVPVTTSLAALSEFEAPARRLELIGEVKGVKIYDDFAHHPTAIQTTLAGLRAHVGDARIIAVLEPRSYTMRSGCHDDNTLAESFAGADVVFMQQPHHSKWKVDNVIATIANSKPAKAFAQVDELVKALKAEAKPGDHILIMSNGGFGGIYNKLLTTMAD